jgi:hypothetical protein
MAVDELARAITLRLTPPPPLTPTTTPTAKSAGDADRSKRSSR